MATLILTVAGSYFGPWGALAGSMLGGLIDRTIDPFGLQPDTMHVEGPRLDNLKIPTASYGVPIDRTWGTIRKGGQLIWALDLIEEVTTEEVGGKGSPPSASVTRYRYYGSFAVSFGYGRPTMRVRKIWCDSKLCYVDTNVASYVVNATGLPVAFGNGGTYSDIRLTDGTGWPDYGVAVGQALTFSGFAEGALNTSIGVYMLYSSGTFPGVTDVLRTAPYAEVGYSESANVDVISSSMTDSETVDWPEGSSDFEGYLSIYPGSIDQAADAVIQASVGAASTPAFREQCYVVFERLPLENFGNRIPSVTVEMQYETSLITVLEDLCSLAGIEVEEQDFSQVGFLGAVGGLTAGRADMRQLASQLAMAYRFDFFESEGKLKAIPNKTAADLTLTAADLGAAAGEERAPALSRTLTDPRALPRQISLSYLSESMDYDTASIVARREVVMSCLRKEVTVPFVLTAAEARALADHLLRKAWIERTTYRMTLPRKYLKLEPADILTLPAAYGSPAVKVTGLRVSPKLVLEVEAVRASIFALPSASSEAEPGGFTPVTDPTWHSSQLYLLDIPILRDLDDDAGLYAGAYTWRDGVQTLYRSADSTNYSAYDTLPGGLVVGSVATALPDCLNPDVWDRAHTLTVTLRSTADSLESRSEGEVLNGANAALVGDEILQFQTASLTTTATYTLSNLLRGRRGTEQHTGTHGASETFILLTQAALSRISTAVGEYGATYYYKGVGNSETVATVPQYALAKQCVGLKPFSPCHVRGLRGSTDQWTFEWKRRGRVNAGWNSLADIPADSTLGESYEIDIMADSTSTSVVRTLASTSTSVVYTAAQQSSDFGGAATAVTVQVYQLGPLGRGFGKKETMP